MRMMVGIVFVSEAWIDVWEGEGGQTADGDS